MKRPRKGRERREADSCFISPFEGLFFLVLDSTRADPDSADRRMEAWLSDRQLKNEVAPALCRMQNALFAPTDREEVGPWLGQPRRLHAALPTAPPCACPGRHPLALKAARPGFRPRGLVRPDLLPAFPALRLVAGGW